MAGWGGVTGLKKKRTNRFYDNGMSKKEVNGRCLLGVI